jgi:hypothetical protein
VSESISAARRNLASTIVAATREFQRGKLETLGRFRPREYPPQMRLSEARFSKSVPAVPGGNPNLAARSVERQISTSLIRGIVNASGRTPARERAMREYSS